MKIKNKQKRNISDWNKMKLIGKRKYIWVNGVLYWGLPMAIMYTFIIQPIRDGFNLNNYLTNHNLIKGFIFNTILFIIGGLAFGLFNWVYNEKKYKNY